ncbi:MAG: hypothetical protein JW388_1650 [Nitrospira sp.]|nr:hypothetical protein [Nitrospira sp.]
MATRSVSVLGVIALLGMMVGGCASEEFTVLSAPTNAASGKDINRIAAGSQQDTQAACLGRIPSDASAGQKMLAENSCRH